MRAVGGCRADALRSRRGHGPLQDLLRRDAPNRVWVPGGPGRALGLALAAVASLGRGRGLRDRVVLRPRARRLLEDHHGGEPGLALRAKQLSRPVVATNN